MRERGDSQLVDERAERKGKFVVGLWLRVVAAGALLSFLTVFTASEWAFPLSESRLAYASLAVLVFVNYPYWEIGRIREFPLSDFYFHWALDLGLITCVVVGLGRPMLSAAITGYLLIVVSSASFISGRASYIVASGASLACVLSALGEVWQGDMHSVGSPGEVWASRVFVLGGSVILIFLIAHIAATLADRVNETNAALALRSAQLDLKNRQLEGVQRDLEFQTSILTHDLRSPIAAAAGAMSLMRRGHASENENVASLIDLVDENLARVEAMIDALQNVQELSLDGAAGDRLEKVRLSEIWEDLLPEVKREIRDKGIEVTLEDGSCIGMRAHLVVALRNLVQNAVRHCPRVGGRIRLQLEDRGEEWQLLVGDNGAGVPEDHREQVFEMFKRVPGGERSKGLGIGLALVRRIAELHGGRVWVTEAAESGAEFRMAIPKRLSGVLT